MPAKRSPQPDPPPTPGPWQDAAGNRWEVVLYWSRVGRRIECSGFELRSVETPPVRLTTSILRAFPFASTVQGTKRQKARTLEWWAGQLKSGRRPMPDVNLSPPPAELVRQAEEWREGAKGPGGAPPQYGPEHFAKVAQVYDAAVTAGRSDPRQAVKDWADANGMNASSSAVAKWIGRAREMGLLPLTTRGRR